MRGWGALAAAAALASVLAGCGDAGAQTAHGRSTASPKAAASTASTPAAAKPRAPEPDQHMQKQQRRSGRQPAGKVTIPPGLDTAKDRGLVLGADASWPQCPKGMGIPEKRGQDQPMPVETSRFVVLGLTNGPAFTPNPCLSSQVDWVRRRHLMAGAYAVLSYPTKEQLARYGDQGPYDSSTAGGRLSNVGYAQARFNLRTMAAAGLDAPAVWMDVEPVSKFDWSSDSAANAAVVRGAQRGYEDADLQAGVYSTAILWDRIVGDLELGLPEWRPAGLTSRAEALRRCGEGSMIQGGYGVLGQWIERNRDMNLTCPGTSAFMDVWFQQF